MDPEVAIRVYNGFVVLPVQEEHTIFGYTENLVVWLFVTAKDQNGEILAEKVHLTRRLDERDREGVILPGSEFSQGPE